MARGDHSDWDISVPGDHTKIGDVPAEICDVKSSAKVIIAKEHVEPGVSNAGGQHLKGSTRVYIDSVIPSLDPEGNNLDTSSTTDDGRFAIATADSNTLKVYIATSAGISTGFEAVRVERVKLEEDMNANSQNIIDIATGTQSGQAIHVGQIDTTAATGQLTLFEPATTADIRVAVLDPPTGNTHIASKKYVDATPHAGGVVQVVNTQTGTHATGTTAIPEDNTTPQKTEGTEFMTLAITPTSATNKLKIDIVFHASPDNVNRRAIVALFQDDTADALAVGFAGYSNIYCVKFTHYMDVSARRLWYSLSYIGR
jgi:hypothetical protein